MRFNDGASATYKQLDDGTWGCYLHDMEGSPGQRVTVTTRAGRTKLEKLDELIYSGDDYELWRIE
jgi:hypothetical protein